MQLTAFSWFWLFVGIALIIAFFAYWVWYVLIAGKATRRNMREKAGDTLLGNLSALALISGVFLAGSISAGGITAADIQHDLEQAGYEVGDVSTKNSTAVIVVDGRILEVDLIKVDDTPHDKWVPVVHCQVYADGSIDDSLQDCETTQ